MASMLAVGANYDINAVSKTDLVLAIDIEDEGARTITAQFAARDPAGRIRFQVYRILERHRCNVATCAGRPDDAEATEQPHRET